MELSNIIEQDSAEVELKNPKTGDGLGVFITVAGPEHEKRRATLYAAQRKTRKMLAKNKGADPWKLLAESDPEEEDEQVTDHLVACTLGWRNLDLNGAPYEFTAANARHLYTDAKFAWVRRQVTPEEKKIKIDLQGQQSPG